ncbi:MAG TPA: CorA family divalent cation transporter [Thermomicrobiales bacterium]|nr:CorA family divalent cation transporter [Thermomicrobiales bacterium]
MTNSTTIRLIESGRATVQGWTLADLPEHDLPGGAYLWIDLVEPDRTAIDQICKRFPLHRLAVNAVFEHRRRPGVSVYKHSTYVQLQHALRREARIGSFPIKVFLGAGFFITIRPDYAFPVERILERWDAAPTAWQAHTSSLLYALTDILVDDLAAITDKLEAALRREDRYGQKAGRAGAPGSAMLESLYQVSDGVSEAYAIALPMRDTMQSLIGDGSIIEEDDGDAYFKDVYDHAVFVADRLDSLQDLAQRIFDMAGALINLRLSDISKQLTVVATIFLPLSFITGYFGQNFGFMVSGVRSDSAFVIYGIALQVLTVAVIVVLLARLKILQ